MVCYLVSRLAFGGGVQPWSSMRSLTACMNARYDSAAACVLAHCLLMWSAAFCSDSVKMDALMMKKGEWKRPVTGVERALTYDYLRRVTGQTSKALATLIC